MSSKTEDTSMRMALRTRKSLQSELHKTKSAMSLLNGASTVKDTLQTNDGMLQQHLFPRTSIELQVSFTKAIRAYQRILNYNFIAKALYSDSASISGIYPMHYISIEITKYSS
jgi:hypothetical protein